MKAVICVPRRGQHSDYDRIWSLLSPYYAKSDYTMFISDSGDGQFNLPAARNVAAKMAGDWDVAAFINADCLIPIESLRRGFAYAAETGRLTVPWDHYYSLTEEGHVAGCDAKVPIDRDDRQRWRENSEWCVQPFYAPGGDVIIPRALFDSIGGWDDRFLGMQPEDAAMLIKVGQFDRLSGPAYHFWHPQGNGVWVESNGAWPEYRARYAELRRTGQFVQRLVDENREINDLGYWWWPPV